ncbi:two-component sensor histidine kinase [Streptomyces antnestii]|uniref:histidine kinase n=1 Tax=Streptomyces antnestii TaxID=2494256 RepID=A0A437PNG3_9ACTN|nr:histidine kinase [Streptomyces sp. San01]RVU23832.1 two-component sensor histidine kinase [Streptomyces sp. San01]
MSRLLAPLTRAVTYTRWLHLLVGAVVALVCGAVYPGLTRPGFGDWLVILLIPVPLLLVAAVIPVVRRAEGLQARLMLFPGAHARVEDGSREPGVSVAPSASWRDRGRTAAWLTLRLWAGCAVAFVTEQLMAFSLELVDAAAGGPADGESLIPVPGHGWPCALLVPVPLLVLLYGVALAGRLMAAAALGLLGPSATERLAALEERTEQLLERNRIARELHDSIGHALTVAVVQAGAARAAADPAFTDRALHAIEETGRAALEDLERVLLVLRESEQPASRRPTLSEADRLLDSARASGAEVDAELAGALDTVPGPVSREGYRILQEALTNVLRHSGTVPIRVAVTVDGARLRLDVRNPLPPGTPAQARTGGSGLRGIRERAALLGGQSRTGPHEGQWRVQVELPLG